MTSLLHGDCRDVMGMYYSPAELLADPDHALLDDIDRDVVGVDQQHHAVGGHCNFQFKVSPPRNGLMSALPNGRDSGSTQGSRRSVTVSVLAGRP